MPRLLSKPWVQRTLPSSAVAGRQHKNAVNPWERFFPPFQENKDRKFHSSSLGVTPLNYAGLFNQGSWIVQQRATTLKANPWLRSDGEWPVQFRSEMPNGCPEDPISYTFSDWLSTQFRVCWKPRRAAAIRLWTTPASSSPPLAHVVSLQGFTWEPIQFLWVDFKCHFQGRKIICAVHFFKLYKHY